MLKVRIRCTCGEKFDGPVEFIGKRIKCPVCARDIQVRAARPAPRARPVSYSKPKAPAKPRMPRKLRLPFGGIKLLRGHTLEGALNAAVDFIRPPRVRTALSIAQYATRIAAWSYLAVVCLVCAVMWELGDRWWGGTVLLFIGRWVFFLPLIPIAVAAAVVNWRALLPVAISFLIVAFPIVGFRVGINRILPVSGGHVRVMSFNVDGGDLVAVQLGHLLTEWKPDIVAFQECGDALREATGSMPGWYHDSARGLCIMTRYPIVHSSVMDRTALETIHEDEAAGIGGSGDVARYLLRTPFGVVNFTNVHLETPRKGLEGLVGGASGLNRRRLDENTRLRDIESHMARGWVDRGGAPPVIVAGDFNTPLESRIFQDHWGDLGDAFSNGGFGLGMTKDNGWIQVRIDHVLTDEHWHARGVHIGPSLGSDHRAVIADLTLIGRG